MRIISGILKGRRFYPPKRIPTRPTTDIAKEGLFNILTNNFNFEVVHFLDLFAGTGSISYEFASRGCGYIRAIERFPKCVDFIEKTIEQLDITGMDVLHMDVFDYIRTSDEKFDIIFAGPPYAMPKIDQLPALIFEYKLLNKDGWFILEHDPNHHFDDHPHLLRSRNYGTTIFSIFSTQ